MKEGGQVDTENQENLALVYQVQSMQ